MLQIKDAYMLKFFESNSSRLPKWCKEGDNVELPFCQIRGKYRMELPEYNTLQPYPHMNEKCPSLPPDYSIPKKGFWAELLGIGDFYYELGWYHLLYIVAYGKELVEKLCIYEFFP